MLFLYWGLQVRSWVCPFVRLSAFFVQSSRSILAFFALPRFGFFWHDDLVTFLGLSSCLQVQDLLAFAFCFAIATTFPGGRRRRLLATVVAVWLLTLYRFVAFPTSVLLHRDLPFFPFAVPFDIPALLIAIAIACF